MNASRNEPAKVESEIASDILEIISDPDKLRRLVELQLSEAERFGQPYDMECLKQNLSDIQKDIRAGTIVQPKSCDDYVAAIVSEYQSNLAAVVKAGCLEGVLTAYGVDVVQGEVGE